MKVCPICCKPLKLAIAHRQWNVAYEADDNAGWRYVGPDCFRNVKASGTSGYKQAGDPGPKWYEKQEWALSAIRAQ